MNIREQLEDYFVGQISKHQINAETLINNPAGVAEHPDIVATIEAELGKIAEFQDKLIALKDLEPSG